MDVILILTYTALATLAFKVFKVPINKWTVPTAALGGVFLMAWLYISMAFYHPYTPYARTYFMTSPISAEVKGKVVEVFVKSDKPLKKGDPLFRIDPTPFQAVVDQLKAELALANKRVQESSELLKLDAGSIYDREQYLSDAATVSPRYPIPDS